LDGAPKQVDLDKLHIRRQFS